MKILWHSNNPAYKPPSWWYRQRCRFGAWLLREHLAATYIHYTDARMDLKEAASNLDTKVSADAIIRRERMTYICIGLSYAMGVGTRWRRYDASA